MKVLQKKLLKTLTLRLDTDNILSLFFRCVVTGLPFYFALLLPICLIMLINCAIFFPVMYGITKGGTLLKDSIQDRQKQNAKRAKASFVVLILLGITWIFAILAIGKLRLIFQWLFCISTTFQGFFIFLLFVIMNTDARRAWQSICIGSKLNGYQLNSTTRNGSDMNKVAEYSNNEGSV